MSRPADITYRQLLEVLDGREAGPAPRGKRTKELVAYQTRVDMTRPIITIPERDLDYQFMVAEAAWILRGQARLDDPVLRKNLQKYSDNGISMSGSYGPPFIEQYRYVIEKLLEDRDTRQAVMTFWRPNPRKSEDVPCTVAMQFLLRYPYLHTNVTMRSSDAWLGWPYDVFTFTMITAFIGAGISSYGRLDFGTLTITSGSQHLYERHWESVKPVIQSRSNGDIQAISLYDLNTPDQILKCLDYVRNNPNPHCIFNLAELIRCV